MKERPSGLPAPPRRLLLAPLSVLLLHCVPPDSRNALEMVRAPVAVTTEGQRAYDDLAAYYRDPSRVSPYERALKRLVGTDAAARERAGRYLLALFRQAREDERKGRFDWKWVHPETRAAWRGRARAFRSVLAEPFGTSADGGASLPAACWLVEEEDFTLASNLEAGLRVLRRVRSPRSVDLFRRLLDQPHPNAAVARGILEETATRGYRDLAPDVRRLCGHYRTSVREAARAAAARLGIADVPVHRPGTAVTPWLEGQIRQIADMSRLTVPADAAWSGATAGLVDALDGEVRRLLTDPDPPGVPPAADGPTGREILAAVSPRDRETVATRLLPLLDALPDDRGLLATARAHAGSLLHAALLRALADERDLLTALVLAHHLAKPLFDGCAFQTDARLLADQLPRRLEDYKSFRLPTPVAWNRMKRGMSRAGRIAFLTERLRLLNRSTRDAAAAAGAGPFDAPQTGARGEDAAAPLINPFRELAGLGPTVDDIPALAPHLANEDLLAWAPAPTGPATLPRVNRPVALLVNDAACRLLVEPAFFDLAHDDQLARIDRIVLWAEANAGKPRAQLAREAAEEAKAWPSFRFAMRKLASIDPGGARVLLERRRDDFPGQRGEMGILEREMRGSGDR